MDHESGIAYGFVMSMAFIVGAGIVLACYFVILNGFVSPYNEQVADNHVSVQTAKAVTFNFSAALLFPVIGLIVVFLWAVIRALEQRRLGGGF
jgi:hypothetical protein